MTLTAATIETLTVGADNVIELVGVTNRTTGLVIADATITLTLRDEDGVAVTGVDGVTMTPVGASPGDYRYTVEDDVALIEGCFYEAEFLIDAGSDQIGRAHQNYLADKGFL